MKITIIITTVTTTIVEIGHYMVVRNHLVEFDIEAASRTNGMSQ